MILTVSINFFYKNTNLKVQRSVILQIENNLKS